MTTACFAQAAHDGNLSGAEPLPAPDSIALNSARRKIIFSLYYTTIIILWQNPIRYDKIY